LEFAKDVRARKHWGTRYRGDDYGNCHVRGEYGNLDRQAYRYNKDEAIALRALLRKANYTLPLEAVEGILLQALIEYDGNGYVSPGAWFASWFLQLDTKQEICVAFALSRIADGMLGEELTPSSESVCRHSGLATPHYYTARKLLVAKGAIVLRDRVKLAPIIELRMPAESAIAA
jgi:hypothetical protein